MRKIISKLLFITVILIGCFYFLAEEKSNAEALIFNNIEALASGEEGTGYRCYGVGSVDCYGHLVEFMIDGMDLD